MAVETQAEARRTECPASDVPPAKSAPPPSPQTASEPKPPRGPERWLPAAVGAVLFIAIAAILYVQQDRSLSDSLLGSQLDGTGALRPLSEVIEVTRALKLVTVVVDSRVRAEMSAESWRGNVSAVVEAPVRYVYGVDLSDLQPDAFHTGQVLGAYDIVIPPPTLIAVEVDGSNPVDEVVEVSGTRFRSRAGEYYLGLARKKIYDQARTNVLPPERLKEMRETTKEQVEDLVSRFVGSRAYIHVRFQNPPENR